MRISLVVAAARNGVIGFEGTIPWKLPDDQQFFKRLTINHPIVMGRKTWHSLGRPLPKRTHLVLSRGQIDVPRDVHLFDAFAKAEKWAQEEGFEELFVIGGEAVYREAMGHADLIYRTLVDAEPDGDAFFPEIDQSHWHCAERQGHEIDEAHAHAFQFETWVRRN